MKKRYQRLGVMGLAAVMGMVPARFCRCLRVRHLWP